MEKHKVEILDIFPITHDVKCFRTEKPARFDFEPGQATEIFLDHEDWRDEGRPFTFTNLPHEDYLEFIIKEYPDHEGVTRELHKLKPRDTLLLDEVFGAIKYSGEGVFIAGGAGITPFISILRMLREKVQLNNNRLIFGNKTSADIILHDELNDMLGENLINILSDESAEGYRSGLISRELIVDNLKTSHSKIYLCGPPPMMKAVKGHLADLELSTDNIVEEEFS
jgi:ferredoxin-NADP reductase